MSLKKISCLCVVLLLFAGMVGVADAATPQGVRLQVTHPANDAWSGIGDSVVVKVQYLPGTAALDSVVVAIVEDTSSTTISDAIGSLTNDSADDFVARFNASNASAADATGFKTFTATFKVTAGQTVESSAKSLSLSALVSTTGDASFSHLTNQSTDATITGSTAGDSWPDSREFREKSEPKRARQHDGGRILFAPDKPEHRRNHYRFDCVRDCW